MTPLPTDIYQENILDHYHNPHNCGTLAHPTHEHCANNPTCGDKICVTLIIKNNLVHDVKFIGEGCTISQATASIITDHIKGKKVSDIQKITKDDVITLLGVQLGIGRIRCAMLGIRTIQKSLEKEYVQK